MSLVIDGVERIAVGDSHADRIVDKGRIGFSFYETASPSSTTGFHLDSIQGGEGDAIVVPPLVIVEGNSQVATGVFTTLESDLIAGLTTSVDAAYIATSGETLDEMQAQIATQVSPLVHNLIPVVVIVLLDGTNNYSLDEATGAEVYGLLSTYADTVHALGVNVKFVVTTVPYRNFPGGGGFDPDPPDINTRINDGNVLTRANAGGKFDRVWDIQVVLGTDPGTFTADGIHFTQEAADIIQPTGSSHIQSLIRAALGGGAGINGGGFFGPGRFNYQIPEDELSDSFRITQKADRRRHYALAL